MPFRPADNSPFRRHYAPMGATRRSLLCLCMCDGFSIAHRRENARIIAEAPPVAEKARRFRGSVPVFTPQGGWKPADTTVFRIAEAPPAAEKARRFRGSVPVFTPQRGWKPADTTVFRIAEAPPVAEKARRFRGSVPVFTPQRGWKPADTTVFRIAEAPPVAEKARRFRGSVPVFTPQRGWKPADTTVFRIAEAPPVAYFSQQFFLFVSGGILFVNSDKKYAKNAARNRWFLDFLSSQELRSLWAVKGIDCATNPLPLPLR